MLGAILDHQHAGHQHADHQHAGSAGGERASPSPTRPLDPCASPAISIAAMPQQQRDWIRKIPSTDTFLEACPVGAERLQWAEAQSAPSRADCVSSAPKQTTHKLFKKTSKMLSALAIMLVFRLRHGLCFYWDRQQ